MAYVAFASAKGSPGVTTTLAALAATWPAERRLLVVEADPSGGDLAARFELAPEPGLVSLAAAGRRDMDLAVLMEHTQPLTSLADEEIGASADGGSGRPRRRSRRGSAGRAGGPMSALGPAVHRVVVGPVAAEQASAALVALGRRLSRLLREVPVDVLVDCGRLDPGSPARQLATDADLLVMMARPVVSEVHHLTSCVAGLDATTAPSLLLVGDHPYPPHEVARVVGASPIGAMPDDPRGAAPLSAGHPDAARMLKRSTLLRSARSLAECIADWLGPVPGTAAMPGGGRLALPAVSPAPPDGATGVGGVQGATADSGAGVGSDGRSGEAFHAGHGTDPGGGEVEVPSVPSPPDAAAAGRTALPVVGIEAVRWSPTPAGPGPTSEPARAPGPNGAWPTGSGGPAQGGEDDTGPTVAFGRPRSVPPTGAANLAGAAPQVPPPPQPPGSRPAEADGRGERRRRRLPGRVKGAHFRSSGGGLAPEGGVLSGGLPPAEPDPMAQETPVPPGGTPAVGGASPFAPPQNPWAPPAPPPSQHVVDPMFPGVREAPDADRGTDV